MNNKSPITWAQSVKGEASKLSANQLGVNPTLVVKHYSKRFVASVALFLSILCLPAHAEDANTRTMLNANKLSNMLRAVYGPDQILTVVEKIEKLEVKRVAPEQPVWILESISGTILYYQGQPKFKMEDASKLVDDVGFRFGSRALEFARTTRSGWLTLRLGDHKYRAYCVIKMPTVVCSLAV